ncbi:MAG: hypothetical protein HZB38_01655 [Planctomycetes bacterium]|nr:hypothetical protein [Planctomycetota bacterium]
MTRLPHLMLELGAWLAFGPPAGAQVTEIMSVYQHGVDGPPAPPHVVVVDVYVDVATTDVWTAAGMRVTALNGCFFRYADGDANTPGLQPNLINTGSANDRFVNMVSKPRRRDSPARFDNCGAELAGSYEPHAADPVLTPTECNVIWFAPIPEPPLPPSLDGYVARIAVDYLSYLPSGDLYPYFVTEDHPADAFLLAHWSTGTAAPGIANATYWNPAPVGYDYWLWTVPEPSAPAFFVPAALVAVRVGRPPLRRRTPHKTAHQPAALYGF